MHLSVEIIMEEIVNLNKYFTSCFNLGKDEVLAEPFPLNFPFSVGAWLGLPPSACLLTLLSHVS
jgi:hypothetical protein